MTLHAVPDWEPPDFDPDGNPIDDYWPDDDGDADADRAEDDAKWHAEDDTRSGATDSNAGVGGEAEDSADQYENTIRQRLADMRITREARRRIEEEERPPIVPPPVKPLAVLLGEPDESNDYRIDKVMPADGRVLLSAQYKAGKTTIGGNLIRSLVDGDPFLGMFAVKRKAVRLVVVDDELSLRQLRQWLRDQGIVNTASVVDVISLRGLVGSFDLLSDRGRAKWATRLADVGCDYLMLDCLRPILDAFGLDEKSEAGKFLVPFDALLAEAGIPDALVVHHMGHSNERSRGDSRLQDWPDAIWRIVREDDDPASARYFSAYGRDVEVPEGKLTFDPATRRLTYSQGSRGDAKAEAALEAVIKLLTDHAKSGGEPLSKSAIEKALEGGHTQKSVREALRRASETGAVTVTKEGPHGSHLHSIASSPEPPEGLF